MHVIESTLTNVINPSEIEIEWNIVNKINSLRKGLYQRVIKGLCDVLVTILINKHTIKIVFTTQLFLSVYQII